MNANTLAGFERLVACSLDVNGNNEEAWVVIKQCFDEYQATGSDYETFKKHIEKHLVTVEKFNDEEYKAFLEDSVVKYMAKKDRARIFEGLLFVILSDKVLTFDECNFLADIAEVLEVDTAILLARVAFNVQEEDVKVDVEEELNNIEIE
ncbi:MAG: hypothetical protein NTW25_14495 [Candidatus Kapabacteria bacterium]|nr:hypothetical protein [Candidatus Kapabacteria bacterium]